MDSRTLGDRLGVRDATEERARRADPVSRSLLRFREQVRRRTSSAVGEWGLRSISRAAARFPMARPGRHQVQVIRDIPYMDSGDKSHTLDVYRPRVERGPFPVVLYVHGGGFTQLSKDTHWIMGLAFARAGYLVVNISYRLAPRDPFPAAIADTCAAYEWLLDNVESYGGDLDRIAVAGESAGANLVTALTVATCYERPEPYARAVFERGVVPRATVPFCGMLQVTDPGRFGRRKDLPFWVDGVLHDVSGLYLRGHHDPVPGALDMADPLVVLERGETPDRPLPPFFIPVGTKDPLLDDTRRLAAALDAMGVPCRAEYYEGEIHAFQAMVWRKPARRCWRDTFGFLSRYVGGRAELQLSATGAEAAAR